MGGRGGVGGLSSPAPALFTPQEEFLLLSQQRALP